MNAIPFDNPHKEVVICAGTNDLKSEPLSEFVYVVEKAAEKLSELASKMPVTIALPPIQDDIPELKVKGEFLRDSLEKVANTTVFNLHDIEKNEWHHPTAKGTVDILKQIHAKKEIIMPDCDADLISPLRYLGVQSLFKTGCRGCNKLTFTKFLCNDCREKATGVNTTKIQQDIDRLTNEMNPPMIGAETTDNGRKRPNEDNVHDDNSKKVAHGAKP